MINILWLRILGSQPHFLRNIPGLSTSRNQLKYNSRSFENRQQDGGNTRQGTICQLNQFNTNSDAAMLSTETETAI